MRLCKTVASVEEMEAQKQEAVPLETKKEEEKKETVNAKTEVAARGRDAEQLRLPTEDDLNKDDIG